MLPLIQAAAHVAYEIAVIFLTVHCVFKSLRGACHFSRQISYVLCHPLQISLCCYFVAFIAKKHVSSSEDKQTTAGEKPSLSNRDYAVHVRASVLFWVEIL